MEAIGQLYDLNRNCLKLKVMMYETGLMFESTQEQEDSFYRTVDGLINKTKSYTLNYPEMKQVILAKEFIEKYKDKLDGGFRVFDFDEMKSRLNELYQNREEFISATEAIIFWPLRLFNECMYRVLNETYYDETFNSLFENIDKDVEVIEEELVEKHLDQ